MVQTDYLADGAKALKSAIAEDAEAARKLSEALSIFDEQEKLLKELIKAQLSS